MQIPDYLHRQNEHGNISQDIWQAAISEKCLLVDATCAGQVWVPIGCKWPARRKPRDDRRYCQADENSKDDPSPETNMFGGKEAKVERQNGNLGDIDAAQVKDTNGNEVFAPNEHYWKVRHF